MSRSVRTISLSLMPVVLVVAGAIVLSTSSATLSQSGDPETANETGTATDGEAANDTQDQAEKKTDKKDVPPNPFPNRVEAPDLTGGIEWLNTSGPIKLEDLKGKVVLLDFWTYCCINCIHVLPDLKYLEEKYDRELVVIGVHSAKFDNEKETGNIREAIMRYEIAHPVVNDAEMKIWRKMGARSWPTLVLIDPEGYYCGQASGEGNRELLDEVIENVIAYHDAKGTLDRTPVRFELEKLSAKPTPLRYPGKLLADENSDRLFISDSNHNRIVITTLDGKLIDIIGTGRMGRKDGSYDQATFDHPQGMALDGNLLYVADTENHMIRVVDLKAKQVRTLSGTGAQARFRSSGGPLETTALNSPWDLLIHEGVLYIAMAGPHQLWSHKLGSDQVGVYAGSGREDITDGPLKGSALAQPSGFATDGKHFYVADSEGSSIRKVDFDPEGEISTIAGTSDLSRGRALFEFGDIDGVGSAARLQHPLGLAFLDGVLYVADTYNHKIKTIDPKTKRVTTWLGDGEAGDTLDPVRFSEPSGLSIANGELYVTDTNNHRIVVVNLKTKQARELKIDGLTRPKPPTPPTPSLDPKEDVTAKAQTVANGLPLQIVVEPKLPEGFKLNTLGPVNFILDADGQQTVLPPDQLRKKMKGAIEGETMTLSVPITGAEGPVTLRVNLVFTYCRGGESGICKLHEAQWRVPLSVEAGTENSTVTLPLTVN